MTPLEFRKPLIVVLVTLVVLFALHTLSGCGHDIEGIPDATVDALGHQQPNEPWHQGAVDASVDATPDAEQPDAGCHHHHHW